MKRPFENESEVDVPTSEKEALSTYADLVLQVVRLVHSLLSTKSRLTHGVMPVRLLHYDLAEYRDTLEDVNASLYRLRELSVHRLPRQVIATEDLLRVLSGAIEPEGRHILAIALELVSHASQIAVVPGRAHATLLHMRAQIAVEFGDRQLFDECLEILEQTQSSTGLAWIGTYGSRAHLVRGMQVGHGVHELEAAIAASLMPDASDGSNRHVGYLAVRNLFVHGMQQGRAHAGQAVDAMIEHFSDLAEEFLPIDVELHDAISRSQHLHFALRQHHVQRLDAWLSDPLAESRDSIREACAALHARVVNV